MQITLTPELEREVTNAVAAGRFANPAEVIAEGLRMLFAKTNGDLRKDDDLSDDDEAELARRGMTLHSMVTLGTIEASLAAADEDIRQGRTIPATVALERLEALIAEYFTNTERSTSG